MREKILVIMKVLGITDTGRLNDNMDAVVEAIKLLKIHEWVVIEQEIEN